MTPLLEVAGLEVSFRLGSGSVVPGLGRSARALRAVDGVTLRIDRGVTLGLAGESGCGKTTLARTIVGLERPATGSIRLAGVELGVDRDRQTRRRMQMVFQDPASSLNPARTVRQTLAELLRAHAVVPPAAVEQRCCALVESVELSRGVLDAYPRALSGGQRQRVGIARALAVEPELLVADEPVAALDVSVQAGVINLLARLREGLGLTILLISHDLAVLRQVCEHIAVMYLGRIVEEAAIEDVFEHPRHPYTRALLRAVPRMGQARSEQPLAGEPPSPVAIPSGCRFHPRCPLAQDICRTDDPELLDRDGHRVACHFA
ncbi:MAG: ABC transporter ATP-binding protein [Thermoleophilia bacterium]|nr:ABC transporter ATP-binding protein [Thermoleophilia bacterium]